MESFLARVRERVFAYLDEVEFNEDDPLLREAYVFHLVLQHEYQHQETLAYLLHMLRPALKTQPPGKGRGEEEVIREEKVRLAELSSAVVREMVVVPEGEFEMGAVGVGFAYDNELPAHFVHVPAFRIDKLLTTNEEYAHFIREGGYNRREWWSVEGWQWRERESWACPLYWNCDEQSWNVRTMFEEAAIQPSHPVTGVSWYEAEAYARFIGKRLPTEAEWEKAAAWDEAEQRKRRFAWGDDEPSAARCNFDNRFWETTPVGGFPEGASAYGCLDMTGNVWEWTADAFQGYTGFAPFPYPEYSEEWFDGDHRVLKGGSWATRAPLLRASFRNFFRRHFRISFSGIRCATDL